MQRTILDLYAWHGNVTEYSESGPVYAFCNTAEQFEKVRVQLRA